MAPKKNTASERGNTTEGLPYDENHRIPSPYAAFRTSTIMESNLEHLVDMGVLPPKDVVGWRGCAREGAPIEDTHESVVFAPFFIRG